MGGIGAAIRGDKSSLELLTLGGELQPAWAAGVAKRRAHSFAMEKIRIR